MTENEKYSDFKKPFRIIFSLPATKFKLFDNIADLFETMHVLM